MTFDTKREKVEVSYTALAQKALHSGGLEQLVGWIARGGRSA